MISPEKLKNIIRLSLEEDIGTGDITTECTVPSEMELSGTFLVKEEGVIAGLELLGYIFRYFGRGITICSDYNDGEYVYKGSKIAKVRGNGRAILSGERVALNFLQRMSGIATRTNEFVRLVENSGVKILDTRKTVPGLRLIDKWAVKIGGGENHRFGLYDMALIKENHITAAGGIKPAVNAVKKSNSDNLKIEVEVKNLDELRDTLELPVDMIMLDNFPVAMMYEAVKMVDGRVPLEASGNVTLETIQAISKTGVNYISIGMLTHSVKALDISLIIDEAS